MADPRRCWVCDAAALTLTKPSDVSSMRPADFAISDASYGRTAAIYRCAACGFLECADMADVVPYYQALEDPAYLESRPARVLQAERLLRAIARLADRELRGLRLLDIGAGSGPLLEAAVTAGMQAEGVEPSRSLHAAARSRGLTVHHGVLPHPDVRGRYDVVTLIDVVEHTTEPVALLRAAAAATVPGGVVIIVTPDVASVAARAMRSRWWHYRLAHVGYYSLSTLAMLCARAGLEADGWIRPPWVLPLPYLIERAERYLPSPLRIPRGAWMESVAIPFNLRDSILLCANPIAPRQDDGGPG